MALEAVQDRLPAVALHVDWALVFRVERGGDFRLSAGGLECRSSIAPIAHGQRQCFVRIDLLIDRLEVEAELPSLASMRAL